MCLRTARFEATLARNIHLNGLADWNEIGVQDIIKSNICFLTQYKIDIKEAQKPTMRNQDDRILLPLTEK
jgi:hypothetical protein